MATAVAGPEIERLIQLLARLPGLGPRSARRAALHLIKKREALMAPLAGRAAGRDRQDRGLQDLRQYRHPKSLHGLHRSAARPAIIVVVADVADLWALERAHAINGRYHVLGAHAVAARRRRPAGSDHRRAGQARARSARCSEIILALNATVDGQTTAHYITDLLQDADVKVTRLAHGVPVGGELDYLDEGTLSAAMRQRTLF